MAVKEKKQRNYFKTFEHNSPTFPFKAAGLKVSHFISK